MQRDTANADHIARLDGKINALYNQMEAMVRDEGDMVEKEREATIRYTRASREFAEQMRRFFVLTQERQITNKEKRALISGFEHFSNLVANTESELMRRNTQKVKKSDRRL
jgi:predicted metal-dependent hydrolase